MHHAVALRAGGRSVVDEGALKQLGVHGVTKMGNVVQVVVGPEADAIAEDIQDLL